MSILSPDERSPLSSIVVWRVASLLQFWCEQPIWVITGSPSPPPVCHPRWEGEWAAPVWDRPCRLPLACRLCNPSGLDAELPPVHRRPVRTGGSAIQILPEESAAANSPFVLIVTAPRPKASGVGEKGEMSFHSEARAGVPPSIVRLGLSGPRPVRLEV